MKKSRMSTYFVDYDLYICIYLSWNVDGGPALS